MLRTVLRVRAVILWASGALAWLPQAVARLSIGWVFVQSGWGKLHSLSKVAGYFASLGIPAPQILAPFVAGVEFVGGMLLLAGLITRVATVPLAATMVVALLTAKKSDIGSASDLYGTAEFLYLLALGYLAVFGAGPLSLDRILTGYVVHWESADSPSDSTGNERA